jgi:DNA-binding response OmpR family regulator
MISPILSEACGMMARILVVEDDHRIAQLLIDELRDFGHSVIHVDRGDAAIELIEDEPFDVAVLDVLLPGMDGFEVCRQLRARGLELPVLMLTARDSEADRVTGLEIGADDYVLKPFSAREVLARIKALLRRSQRNAAGAPARSLAVHDCTLDRAARTVLVAGEQIVLSQREFDLLALLMGSAGQVVDRDQLMRAVWGRPWDGLDRSVDACVLRLRERLGRDSTIARALVGVRGRGYRLDELP